MDATLLHIQPAAPQPIYRQIAEQIRRLVAGGQLAAGALLPTVRAVAAAHAINPMTVSKVSIPLEAEGVLDRQSVAQGKSVSVSVDICGRRNTTNNLTLTDHTIHHTQILTNITH